MTDTILSDALRYAARGWLVLPVWWLVKNPQSGKLVCACPKGAACPSPGKHPLVAHGVKDASRRERVIRGWWERWPLANVAVATGRASKLLVVDLDTKLPDTALHLLEATGPIDPKACLGHVLTGSGGSHYYLRADDGGRCRQGWPVSGVDIRGDGGFVVAPPSLHVSGARYEWAERSYWKDEPC
jgi:putative DNA primase/helicase